MQVKQPIFYIDWSCHSSTVFFGWVAILTMCATLGISQILAALSRAFCSASNGVAARDCKTGKHILAWVGALGGSCACAWKTLVQTILLLWCIWLRLMFGSLWHCLFFWCALQGRGWKTPSKLWGGILNIHFDSKIHFERKIGSTQCRVHVGSKHGVKVKVEVILGIVEAWGCHFKWLQVINVTLRGPLMRATLRDTLIGTTLRDTLVRTTLRDTLLRTTERDTPMRTTLRDTLAIATLRATLKFRSHMFNHPGAQNPKNNLHKTMVSFTQCKV